VRTTHHSADRKVKKRIGKDLLFGSWNHHEEGAWMVEDTVVSLFESRLSYDFFLGAQLK